MGRGTDSAEVCNDWKKRRNRHDAEYDYAIVNDEVLYAERVKRGSKQNISATVSLGITLDMLPKTQTIVKR